MLSKKLDTTILKILFSSSAGLEAFTLYRRTQVYFPEFTASINRLNRLDLIHISEQKITITKRGVEIISSTYSGTKETPTWKKIPERFIGKKLEPHEFYIPSRSRLDKSFTIKSD